MVNTQLFDLTGKVALLTGASKGMGRAMAEALAEHGANVVLSSRKQDACDAAAAEINALCGEERAVGVACNAGYRDQLENLVAQTHDRFGLIDVLVSNAGVNPFYGPMSEIPDEAFDKIMSTNVKAAHWVCQMAARDMVEKGGGSIIVMSSAGAFKPSEVLGAYSISKLADIGLVRNLALEYGPSGVRANAICPSVIKTDFAQALWDNPEAAQRERELPLRRFGEADDLKGIAVYLASDASAYMTGQALTFCGGANMWS